MEGNKYPYLLLFRIKIVVILSLSFLYCPAYSQLKLKGTVYDASGVFPLEAVSVINSSGNGTLSDSVGHYALLINANDSVWFSYLGKETRKFSIAEIPDLDGFNISLHTGIQVLKEVRVKSPNYKLDSIQNRIDYAKVFNYKKPTFGSVVEAISITGIVINIDELIRVFQYRKKKMMLGFQSRLLDEEQQKFILHRFTKPLVSEITGLKDEMLDSFMFKYRPSCSLVVGASDYVLRKYIKDMYEIYKLELFQSKRPDD